MNDEPTTLSPQQSLNLIASMIEQAKGNVRHNSFYYLFWGWILILAHLGSYVLNKLDFAYPYAVWLIVIPAWGISFMYGTRQSKKRKRSITHLEKINITLWISFGTLAIVIPFLGYFINYQITPMILLIGCMPTVTSGVILKYRPLMWGGGIFLVAGLLCFLASNDTQPLIAAVAIALGYLVPGYLLKAEKDGDV